MPLPGSAPVLAVCSRYRSVSYATLGVAGMKTLNLSDTGRRYRLQPKPHPVSGDITMLYRKTMILLAPLALALTLGAAAQQQTTTPATPDATNTPATTQVTTTSTTTTDSGVPATPSMTKREMKAQRKQQKHEENASKQLAKAQKDRANALKHQNKSQDEQEKANTPQ